MIWERKRDDLLTQRNANPEVAALAETDLHLLAGHEIAHWERFALERRVRALSSAVFLGDSTVLCRVLGRYKMFVDASDVGFASHLMLDGIWEPWVTQFVASVLKPGMTFVDVGANFGYYTLLGADFVGPAGRVIAVEPNARAVGLLSKSLVVNGLTATVDLVAAAAGEQTGRARLLVPEGEPKNARMAAFDDPNVDHAFDIEVVSLNDLLRSESVDFIKVDVEGAEEAVIAGALNVLRRNKPLVLIEFNPLRCRQPAAALSTLRGIYGDIAVLSVDGSLRPASDAFILEQEMADDKMLALGFEWDGPACPPVR